MMDPRTNDMERLLAKLGEAHQAGAFEGDAAPCPWQTGRAGAQSPAQRRFAWFWVGAPLAAAAAVAVLFVGPQFFSRQAATEIARTVPTHLLPAQPELHVAEVDPTSHPSLDCRDYNGDGVVNGDDIQGFVDRLRDTGAGPQEVDVEEFVQRCLLGG